MIDQVERAGLSREQRAWADEQAAISGKPVYLSGRIGDKFAVLVVGQGPNAWAVHRGGRMFNTGATWIPSLAVVAEPDEVEARQVQTADLLEQD
jgi:hypothetical protein